MKIGRAVSPKKETGFLKEKTMYQLYKKEIYERNYKMLEYTSIVLLLFGSVFIIGNYFLHFFNTGTKYIYSFWIISSCLIQFSCRFLKQHVLTHATTILYLFIGSVMLSNIISGTYFYRDGASAIMMGCIASMPILLFDERWRFYLFDICVCIVFIICSFHAKELPTAITDCVNTICFCIISCMIGMSTIRLKFADIKAKYEMMEQLETDSLTGLLNRHTVIQYIESYFHNEEHGVGALFIIDIDNFKHINDTYGHLEGDYVLIQFANLIRDTFRDTDYKARLGGDEFLVMAKNVNDIEWIKEKAAQLNRTSRLKASSGDTYLPFSVSIGIVISENCDHFEELYVLADKMLYEVKRNSKAGYEIFQMINTEKSNKRNDKQKTFKEYR